MIKGKIGKYTFQTDENGEFVCKDETTRKFLRVTYSTINFGKGPSDGDPELRFVEEMKKAGYKDIEYKDTDPEDAIY